MSKREEALVSHEDGFADLESDDERRLHRLRQAALWCLIGHGLCVELFILSFFLPPYMGFRIAGPAFFAALPLLFMAALFRLCHASQSIVVETGELRSTGITIVRKAHELARQWAWATALCRLPRGSGRAGP